MTSNNRASQGALTFQQLAINDAMMPIIMAVGNYVTFWKILQMWPFYLLMPNDGDECGFGAMIGYVSDSLPNRR
jgi:hypothetical protein